MGMGLELTLQEQVQKAHIETVKAWAAVCDVINQPFNPHRREICRAYILAVKAECEIVEKYTRETGLIPELRLPFEFYYLYYKPGTYKRRKWEKICKETERTRNNEKNVEKC